MVAHHAVFGGVEEVVEEVLVPCLRRGGGEGSKANVQDVHVQEGDLGPGCEGRG